MAKYYQQVSHLQDWSNRVRDQIEDSFKVTDAVSSFFCQENQIMVYNIVTETLTRCLEGKTLNNFLDFMRTRQDQIGKKKLSMLNNSYKDR